MVNIGTWQDRWVEHPFPNMGEPDKAMCYLTDIQGYDEDHLAWLYNKASLHAIDRFFMQVRRRLSLLERPISSSASPGRRWFGYGPYKPGIVGKLLDIFRVFYNFVEVGKNKQTPAMRLGLAKGKITVEDIVLLSAVKLTAIIHYVYWGRYLSQKKDCRLSISSPLSLFFNTLSDRLAISAPAFSKWILNIALNSYTSS